MLRQLFCILFKLLLQHVIECEVLVVIASCERECNNAKTMLS